MLDEKSVIETGFAISTGGRRPQMYSLNPNLMYIVSVAIDQFVTRIAIIDMKKKIVGEVESLELSLHDNPEALFELRFHIREFINRSGIPESRIAGIGLGMPGLVDLKKGINHSFLKTQTGSIISFINEEIDLPVCIDNDSRLIALAELKLGAALGRKNVMVVNLAWGIGLGMILNGEMFRGNNGFAGEFSHIPLFLNNKMCRCGKMGCLETETSLYVMAERVAEGLKEGRLSVLKSLSLEHIDQAANEVINAAVNGDKFAIEVLSETGYNIGRGLSILILLVNPEMIVISGRGCAAGRLWLAPIQQAINEHSIPRIAENIEIKISTLGHQAELMGAAALVMESWTPDYSNTGGESKKMRHLEV